MVRNAMHSVARAWWSHYLPSLRWDKDHTPCLARDHRRQHNLCHTYAPKEVGIEDRLHTAKRKGSHRHSNHSLEQILSKSYSNFDFIFCSISQGSSVGNTSTVDQHIYWWKMRKTLGKDNDIRSLTDNVIAKWTTYCCTLNQPVLLFVWLEDC